LLISYVEFKADDNLDYYIQLKYILLLAIKLTAKYLSLRAFSLSIRNPFNILTIYNLSVIITNEFFKNIILMHLFVK